MGFWFEAKTENNIDDLEENIKNWLVYVFNFKENRKFGFYNEDNYLRIVDEKDENVYEDEFLDLVNLTEEEYELIVEKAEFFKNKANENREEMLIKRKEEEIKKYKKYESGKIPVPNKETIQEMFKEGFNIENLDTSQVTDMSELFKDINKIQDLDLSNWDVSNVKDMNYMFYNSNFNGDISNWDVSNVKDMSYMFYESKFNGDISNWNVGNVKDMRFMFRNSKFNRDISNWNASNVENAFSMFSHDFFENNPPSWYKE